MKRVYSHLYSINTAKIISHIFQGLGRYAVGVFGAVHSVEVDASKVRDLSLPGTDVLMPDHTTPVMSLYPRIHQHFSDTTFLIAIFYIGRPQCLIFYAANNRDLA